MRTNMQCEDSLEERQNNELEALKSIFNDELIDLRTNPNMPLNLSLKLGPLQSSKGFSESYTKISLRVVCSKNYPNEAPELFLEDKQGISDARASELLTELLNFSKKHCGNEIIYQLAQLVQEFLHKYNTRPPGSFYEQMLSEQKLREENKLHINKMQIDQKRQELHTEILKKKEILKSVDNFENPNVFDGNISNKDILNKDSVNNSLEIPSANKCTLHRFTKEIEFSVDRKIIRGCCIDHSEMNIVTYIAVDLHTGEPLYVKECTINCAPNFEKRYRNSQISCDSKSNQIDELLINIKLQLNKLIELKHGNIVPYEDYKCFIEKNSITIFLLQPFIMPSNNLNIGLHDLAKSSLGALSYLHRNKVSHGNLSEKSIVVDNTGCVKLTDFGLQLVASADFSLNLQKDFQNIAKIIRKAAPLDNDPHLWNFIKICENADKNSTADALLQHPYMYSYNDTGIAQLPKYSDDLPIQEEKSFLESFPKYNKSRILSEFTEIMKIGNGAFGDVIKVRNNLDGCEYAIKKIPLNPRNRQLYGKITREVKLLSKLYHENVVRYYNSWIETAKIEDAKSSKLNSPSSHDGKSWSVTHEARKSMASGLMEVINNSDSDSDDFIEFMNDSQPKSTSDYSEEYSSDVQQRSDSNLCTRELQYMYIQMEFCEKSTLRSAIDDGLAANSDRCWRLFREIIDGLAHIHQQGMIHRDLKPVNIFIDSRDHVKIGDFGLATTSVMVRSIDPRSILVEEDLSNKDISLTGHIGTALYAAPELVESTQKVQYNEKVDIYSLGIILFEMIYPFQSMMERAKVLQNLRLPSMKMPSDASEKCGNQIQLIKWLLNHDPAQRPSSAELLASDLVPPVPLEDRALFEMIRITLNNPQGKAYKHLIENCLEQENDDALDITYHVDLFSKNQAGLSYIKEIVIQVFRKHGAIDISTPLLTPTSTDKDIKEFSVKLMTHSGCVVTLPTDLRLPFARYAALSDIKYTRRFTISHVYLERRIFGFHPRQVLECAMDILVNTEQDLGHMMLLLDAELISIAAEVMSCIPGLQSQRLKYQLNHSGLLQAALSYCSVPKDKRKQLYSLLNDYKDNKINKFSVQMFLTSLGAGSSNFNLLEFLDSETVIGSDCQISTNTILGVLTKARGEAGKQAKEIIIQIQSIAKLALSLGVQFPIYVCPGLRNDSGNDGVTWKLVCDAGKRRNKGDSLVTVLASGVKYNETLFKLRQRYGQFNVSDRTTALGITIYPEKILQALFNFDHHNVDMFQAIDAAVVTSDPHLLKDVSQILRRLWSSGKRAIPLIYPSETVRDDLKYSLITPCGGGDAIMKHHDNERFQEKKISLSEISDSIPRSPGIKNTSESNTSIAVSHNIEEGIPQINIHMITSERIHASQKRRYEYQAKCHMSEAFSKLNSRYKVHILCINLQGNILSILADKINVSRGERGLTDAVVETIELFPKSKKFLLEIDEKAHLILSENNTPILCLYSLISLTYRILL